MRISKEVLDLIFSLGLDDEDTLWNIKEPSCGCDGTSDRSYCSCLISREGKPMRFGDFKKLVKKVEKH